jgi:hypothetical protein
LKYPQGKNQAMKALAERPYGMSRGFVLGVTGKGGPFRPPLSPKDEKKVAALLAKIEKPPKRVE